MARANEDIRLAAMRKDVYLYQIAERCNLSDANFSRLLRKELSEEQKKHIFSIINDLNRKEVTS